MALARRRLPWEASLALKLKRTWEEHKRRTTNHYPCERTISMSHWPAAMKITLSLESCHFDHDLQSRERERKRRALIQSSEQQFAFFSVHSTFGTRCSHFFRYGLVYFIHTLRINQQQHFWAMLRPNIHDTVWATLEHMTNAPLRQLLMRRWKLTHTPSFWHFGLDSRQRVWVYDYLYAALIAIMCPTIISSRWPMD